MAWACAKIGLLDEHFLDALSEASLAMLSEFITQDLSNSAWACATLIYRHDHLLNAISREAIAKISAFGRQELSNTAWAFAKLKGMDRHLMDALSREVRARLDLFDGQALANLSDSVAGCAGELGLRLAPTLDFFVANMPRSLDGWSGSAFVEVLHRVGVDNFGILGTRSVLQRMGVPEAPTDFVQRALRRIEQAHAEVDMRKETYGLIHKRVLCYGEWDLILPDGEPMRGSMLRENGIRVGHNPPPAWLRSFATPINFMIGRDLCGEFQLVTGIGLFVDAAMPGRVTGAVSLLSSSTPCVSCVAVVRQLQQRYPGLQVAFSNGEDLC